VEHEDGVFLQEHSAWSAIISEEGINDWASQQDDRPLRLRFRSQAFLREHFFAIRRDVPHSKTGSEHKNSGWTVPV